MSNLNFGEQFRKFRMECRHPQTGKAPTQQELVDILYAKTNLSYTSATISDWERNQRRINISDRFLLVSFIKIFKEYGGVKTIEDANALLESGGHRDLYPQEKDQLFPEIRQEENIESLTFNRAQQKSNFIKLLLGNIFFNSSEEFQEAIDKINDGPPPAWPRMVAAIMGKISDWIGASNPLRMLIWLAIWIFAYTLLRPSIQWPFPNRHTATDAVYIYVFASYTLPLLIGLFIHTDQDNVWNERKEAPHIMIRLYTYQGAFVGFHVGYFFIFMFCLIMFYLHLISAPWVQFLLLGFPLFLGIVGARVVPDNLWKAYKRLSLSDGWIFFIFIIVSPFWAWFFLEYYSWLTYPTCGTVLVLTAFIIATWMNRSRTKTVTNKE